MKGSITILLIAAMHLSLVTTLQPAPSQLLDQARLSRLPLRFLPCDHEHFSCAAGGLRPFAARLDGGVSIPCHSGTSLSLAAPGVLLKIEHILTFTTLAGLREAQRDDGDAPVPHLCVRGVGSRPGVGPLCGAFHLHGRYQEASADASQPLLLLPPRPGASSAPPPALVRGADSRCRSGSPCIC